MQAYNIKCIEYPNGSIQLRIYDKPMKSSEPINFYENDAEQCVCPFTGGLVKVQDEFVEPKVLTDEERENNRYRNANRTKQMVFQYSRCAFWEWFVTFTFSGEKIDRYNYDDCSKAVRSWLHNQRRVAPELQYLVVPEQHKDGAWHFHGLLARCGDMKFYPSGIYQDGVEVYNMIKYQYGYTTATKVKDIDRVSKYVGKYITKNICDLTPGKQRYFVSQNLPLPRVSTYFSDEQSMEESISDILREMDKDIAHVSHTRATHENYTNVTYLELE